MTRKPATRKPVPEAVAQRANANVSQMLFECAEMAREHPPRAVLQEMVWASMQFAQSRRVCMDCYVAMVALAMSKALGRPVNVLVVEDDDDDDADGGDA